jgi:hypothetical protein
VKMCGYFRGVKCNFPFYVFFGFPIFCLLYLFFVLLGFLVFALVFPCIVFFCLFCVFFDFYSFIDIFCVCFAVLHPLSGLFPRLHCVKLLTRPLVYGVYLHVISFISLYFFVFACNKSCFDQPALGCDA